MLEHVLQLNVQRVEDALEQLKHYPGPNVIHLQFERTPELGHRAVHLSKFLSESFRYLSYENLEWYIFNELEHHVNENTHFTFSEHAHFLHHYMLSKKQRQPRVTTVFTEGEDMPGEFGIGVPR
jgi:hypothetical protein